jgi:hypothetical protein
MRLADGFIGSRGEVREAGDPDKGSLSRLLSGSPDQGVPRWPCSHVHHSGDPKRYFSQ